MPSNTTENHEFEGYDMAVKRAHGGVADVQ